MATDIAILAGGCFWCVEPIFNDLKGVLSVESGYTGGRVANPTYRQVCDGDTGHAEAVRVEFDPDIISYDDILRSEEHTSELQSLMRISYAVFCLKKKNKDPPTDSKIA